MWENQNGNSSPKTFIGTGAKRELIFSIPTMYQVFLYTITHLILTTILGGRWCYLHFINKKIEAHKINFQEVSHVGSGRVEIPSLFPFFSEHTPASSRRELWDFLGGPVAKTHCSQCRGLSSIPIQGIRSYMSQLKDPNMSQQKLKILCAIAKAQGKQTNK